jgi:hypothetical protein
VSIFSAFRTISGLSALAALLVVLPVSDSQADPTPSPMLAAANVSPPSVSSARSQTPSEIETFSAPSRTKTVAGFRMGGAPEMEFVFGDIDLYKRQIDSFKKLHEQMTAQRVAFAHATHSAQQVLAKPAAKGKRGVCPASEVAVDYAAASEAGLAFRRLGGDFESTYFSIRRLDELGESSGLTPDYRWHVKKSRSRYRQALTDLKEMRSVFRSELEAGLRSRGCKSQKLLSLAKTLQLGSSTTKSDTTTSDTKQGPTKIQKPIRASTATFFVDNETCSDPLAVHVDGTLLGKVAAGKKAAFQSLLGRHSLCLLSDSGKLTCGDTGTLRNAFVYDGFTVSRHCEK